MFENAPGYRAADIIAQASVLTTLLTNFTDVYTHCRGCLEYNDSISMYRVSLNAKENEGMSLGYLCNSCRENWFCCSGCGDWYDILSHQAGATQGGPLCKSCIQDHSKCSYYDWLGVIDKMHHPAFFGLGANELYAVRVSPGNRNFLCIPHAVALRTCPSCGTVPTGGPTEDFKFDPDEGNLEEIESILRSPYVAVEALIKRPQVGLTIIATVGCSNCVAPNHMRSCDSCGAFHLTADAPWTNTQQEHLSKMGLVLAMSINQQLSTVTNTGHDGALRTMTVCQECISYKTWCHYCNDLIATANTHPFQFPEGIYRICDTHQGTCHYCNNISLLEPNGNCTTCNKYLGGGMDLMNLV